MNHQLIFTNMNPNPLLIMKSNIITLLALSALLTGCHPKKTAELPKNIVKVAIAESLESAKVQSKSEYIAMLRGDVETELSFKVGGILELIGRDGEAQDWQEGTRIAKGEILGRLKQE